MWWDHCKNMYFVEQDGHGAFGARCDGMCARIIMFMKELEELRQELACHTYHLVLRRNFDLLPWTMENQSSLHFILYLIHVGKSRALKVIAHIARGFTWESIALGDRCGSSMPF